MQEHDVGIRDRQSTIKYRETQRCAQSVNCDVRRAVRDTLT